MKSNIENVRFCLICNYISKLEKCLRDTCMSFKFNSLPKEKIKFFLKKIIREEKITAINSNALDNIIHNYKSDIRSMINYLQRSNHNRIISDEDIKSLLNFFLKKEKTKSLQSQEKKLVDYLYKFNIEKNELIIKIIYYILNNYELSEKLINFIKIVIRYDNFYLPEFNTFFISNVVSLLSN